MKVKFLRSATAIVETHDVRILMDPWLVDGAYFGSWAHWPTYKWDPSDFAGLTHIYVSHVHPDHFDWATMMRLDKHIPVLINRYATPFLKNNILNLGFRVIELPHGQPIKIGDTTLWVYAADNCDPVVCGRFFDCKPLVGKNGSTQIDSLLHITDGKFNLINTNDCPYGLAKSVLPKLPQPDLLMTSYGAAGPYPQCFKLPIEDKLRLAKAKEEQMTKQAMDYVSDLEPFATFPFAGQYVLSGKLSHLNQYLGLPDVDVIYERMANAGIDVVRIPHGGTYDLSSQRTDKDWVPTDTDAKKSHIDNVLRKVKFTYELDPVPTSKQLDALFWDAALRLEAKRLEYGIESATTVIVNGYELPMGKKADGSFIGMNVDNRLLYWLLSGPKFAHWNNAEIGSHIMYDRSPDVFHRGLNNLMSFFHA